MATNIISELDTQLASLNQLKPPGASKGKIASITQLCVNNIQAESNIIQSLYRALKKAPATHKLGAIYVLDSVVRRWIESAKSSGQSLNVGGRGEPGTYPAAIKRVTELMPALFDDTLKGIPPEQKEKLEGMVKIWEKGNTFPAEMLASFRTKLGGVTTQTGAQANGTGHTTSKKAAGDKFSAPLPSRPLYTPVGYPPQHLYEQGFIARKTDQPHTDAMDIVKSPQQPQTQQMHQQQAAPPPTDVNSILAALAAKPAPTQQPQQAATQQNVQPQMPPNIAALFQQQGGSSLPPGFPQQQPQQLPFSTPQAATAFPIPQNFPGFQPPQPPPSVPQHYQHPPPPQAPPPQQADPLGPLRSLLPQSILGDQQKLVQALKVLQELQSAGIPMDQWAPVIAAFDQQYQPPQQQAFGGYNPQTAGRGRSRSPDRGRGRASPIYGNYENSRMPGNDAHGAQGVYQQDQRRYRQRSPIRDSPAPPPGGNLAMNGMPMQPKYIAIDNALQRNSIKVLSRTLFVGGANGSEQEIRTLFERFGRVQTCIANRDKRHAFVKMTTRVHALNAKQGMERLQTANDRDTMNIARQTKWGVGFGPRECCDYTRGESIIPIDKLTDADMKWLLTAEYGGTGGSKVEAGMVLEEPDIEIGAGVSSKAMSKRVLPEHAQQQSGTKRQRDDGGGQRKERNKRPNDSGNGGGYGYSGVSGGPLQPMQMEAYGYARPEPVAVATPPAVPGFGFMLPGGQQPTYR